MNGYIIENKGIYTLSEKGKLIADRITSDLFVIFRNLKLFNWNECS